MTDFESTKSNVQVIEWDGKQQNESVRHIGWDELDKKKYYVFGPTFMIGVRLIIFPPTLIKTRLQVQRKSSLYNGTYDAFKKILKYEGVRGLYRGFATNTLTLFSGQIYITTLEITRTKVPGSNQATKSLMAGVCASLAGQTVTVPVDIISQKQMMVGQSTSTKQVFRSAWSIIRHIYRTSGIQGFYKGYIASLLTYAPSSGIWWGTYYSFTQFFNEITPYETPTIVIQGMSGPAAATVSAILTNPADTVRTRLQVCCSCCCNYCTVMHRLSARAFI